MAGPVRQDVVVVRPADSLPDYLFCRRLRNRVRLRMTGDTEPISLFRQLKFYIARPAGIALYIAWLDGQRAGYLLLRPHADSTLITEAVDDRFRRRGVAVAMIDFAKQVAPDLTADILIDNAPSLSLHAACGFVRTGECNGVSTWRFRKE